MICTLFFGTNQLEYFISYDENKKKMDAGFPKSIEQSFPGVTGKITAAFQYKGGYFFKYTYI